MGMKKNRKRRNWGIYILAFCIPIVGLLVHMLIGKCYPFGDNSILLGDARDQYLSFFTELYNRLQNRQSLFFSWNGGMGYDFYTNMMYYLMSPFNLIALCFGGYSMELGMIVTMAVEIGACAVSAMYYFRHTYLNTMEHGKINNGVTLVFSIAYAMCNYILAYQYNLMWLTSLILVPLVMLGIEKIIRKQDYRLYSVTLVLTFIMNFYFAWFVCILSFFWFIDQNRGSLKEWLNRLVKWFLVSVCAAAAAAAVLIPCYILACSRNDSFTDMSSYSWKNIGNIGNFIQSFFWGHTLDIAGHSLFTFNTYCGIIIVVLMVCYMFNVKIEWKKRLRRILIIGFLAASLCIAGLIYVMHGMAYPHSVSNRDGFLLTVFILVTAFEQVCRLQKMGIFRMTLVALILAGLTIGAFIWNQDVQNIACYLGTILLLAYILICLFLFERKSITKKSLIVNVIVVGLIEIMSNSCLINDESNVDIRVLSSIAASEWEDDYTEIQLNAGERKTSWVFSTNNQIYSDTNLFSSMKNTEMVWLFQKLGLSYQNNGGCYIYRGTTPVTAAMFNVQNVLTDSPAHYSGYSCKSTKEIQNNYDGTSRTLQLLENDNRAGLGFMASDTLASADWTDGNIFEVQNGFVSAVLGEETDVFIPVDISDVEISGNYCLPFKQKGNVFPYMSTAINDSMMNLALGFSVPEDMHLYIHLSDGYRVMTNVYIDGKEYSAVDTYPSNGETLDLGNLKKGQRVILIVYTLATPGVKGETAIDFYKLDESLMQKFIDQIRENQLNVTHFEDTSIEGHISVKKDGLLYTSIPYYQGFRVFVDGKETEIRPIGQALVGVELQAGEHDIRITYFPYGLKLGIIFSILGMFGIVFIIGANTRKLQSIQERKERTVKK